MESMVSKTFMKVMSFAASLFMTIMAGIFGLLSISCLVMSIIEKDLFTASASAATGFIAYALWSVRRDV